MSKKIVIIDAGIAGLATGCYGQLNGYETEIYEMRSLPGGLCTAWKRKGYTFDGCIHWLMGANPRSSLHKMWNEIGALRGLEFHIHDAAIQMEDHEGNKLSLCADIDRLERQMLDISPEDAPLIGELAAAIRLMTGFAMPMDKPQDMYNILDYLKMLKVAPKIKKIIELNKISLGQFLDKFKNPFLREALSGIIDRDYPLMVYAMVLGTYANRDSAWPMGGSLEFAKNIEESYKRLGGRIQYNSRVESILVRDGKAEGIRLADGSEIFADYVISASDGFATVYKLLGGQYIDNNIKSLYSDTPLAPTSIQVSLGVGCDISDEPYAIGMRFNKPVMVGNIENNYFFLRHYCYDKSMAPAGKSAVTSFLYSDYEYWEKLYRNKEAYEAEKKKIADAVIEAFELRFPYAKGKIESVDVSTPYTYTRYTGTWKGSYMGWMQTPRKPMINAPGKLPGLANFYMAGQWAHSSGGIPVGLITGRWAIMRICRDDHKRFTTRR